ncbi:MAG: hypothetical protein A2Z25_02905 [Planctomycetes bacterium RBG_16_55_9]|nr:MAG: hypothetical protein A2Z25_02905 [Planctomycetes bacterium RBG_16_55_9]
MARITFSLQELVDIAVSNGLLPGEVVRARVKGEKIHFVIKTNTFILPYVPASLSYVSFDGRDAIFKLTDVGGPVNKVMGWLQHALKLKMPPFVKVEYPKVSVDISGLLEEKNIRGLHVKDIVLKDGQFTITTDAA